MSSANDPSAGAPTEFLLRRAPHASRPDHPYALLWTSNDDVGGQSTREIGRGDYRWAVRTARMLSIPRGSIEHADTRGLDDGYEGWHLNARIVTREV